MTEGRPSYSRLSSLLGEVNHYLALHFGFPVSLAFSNTLFQISQLFFSLISILSDYCQILASLWAPPCRKFWYKMCQDVELWIMDFLLVIHWAYHTHVSPLSLALTILLG